MQPRPSRPILVTIVKKEIDGDLRLLPRPLSFAAQQQVQDTRLMILKFGTDQQQEELKFAFKTASEDKIHDGDPEPLLVLSRDLGDFLIWQVLDENGTPQSGFEVDIHPFDIAKVPDKIRPRTLPIPPAFDGKFPRQETNGFVISGLPSVKAVNHPEFWWHKYTGKLEGAEPLDA